MLSNEELHGLRLVDCCGICKYFEPLPHEPDCGRCKHPKITDGKVRDSYVICDLYERDEEEAKREVRSYELHEMEIKE
ncbi:MAG: hypothetical protein ACXQS8_06510 [Candidatus Helarchaeales archaeon]